MTETTESLTLSRRTDNISMARLPVTAPVIKTARLLPYCPMNMEASPLYIPIIYVAAARAATMHQRVAVEVRRMLPTKVLNGSLSTDEPRLPSMKNGRASIASATPHAIST